MRSARPPRKSGFLRREIERLVDFPRLGVRVANPDGGDEEIRELAIRQWVARYVVDGDSVIVVRLWDSRRAVKRGELREGWTDEVR